MRAEYNLAQAVAMVNLIAEQWSIHTGTNPYVKAPYCEQCRYGAIEEPPDVCEYGARLLANRAKWKRRCRYAARREGVKMTV